MLVTKTELLPLGHRRVAHFTFSTMTSLRNSNMATCQRPNPRKLFVLTSWVTLGCFALLLFSRWSSISKRLQILPGRATNVSDLDTATGTIPDRSGADHPIKKLFHKSEAEFNEILSRQSTTFEMAASEYSRRYQRDPPPGFKVWYEYAARHKFLMIDEFDIIDEALAPFWGLSGREVKRRLNDVRDNGPLMSHCVPSNGTAQAGCKQLGGELLRLLREPEISQYLPEVDLLINTLDEPRVLLWGDNGLVSDRGGTALLHWTDLSHRHVWDELTASCYRDSSFRAASSLSAIHGSETTGSTFYTDKSHEVDLCRHPEYSAMHGVWRSPMTLSTTRSTVPILSPAVLSTMGDIPFPAAAYSNQVYTYEESEDTDWENKIAGLYWAGSTTGSFQNADDQGWKRDHRQRFVSLANNLEPKDHTYLWRSDGDVAWKEFKSSTLNHSFYKVHFTDVVQCADRTTGDAVRAYSNIHDVDTRKEAFRYTLTFDLDGNGHSGRFYRLLNSRSLPLKQTVFREWHDERLQPWQHYVPISLTMEDLPEVVRYMVDEDEGRQVAALIAEKGRQWSLRALRPVDQVIYLFRLMIELSRLQDPSRPASR
jgi:hypothetical protein